MRIEIFVVKTELDKKQDATIERLGLTTIKDRILQEFGGLTEIPNCKGYWKDSNEICTDNVEIWLIYADNKDSFAIVEDFAKQIKYITYQKQQAFAIDGKLYLV